MPIFVGMDIARTLDGLCGNAAGFSFKRALCVALVAAAPLTIAAQPATEASDNAMANFAMEAADALRALVPGSLFLQAGAAEHVVGATPERRSRRSDRIATVR